LSAKEDFQKVLEELRKNISLIQEDYMTKLGEILVKDLKSHKLSFDDYFQGGQISLKDETCNWLFDAFLDKVYEINFKAKKIIEDKLSFKVELKTDNIKECIENLAFGKYARISSLRNKLNELGDSIEDYKRAFESIMSQVRRELYAKDWSSVKKLNTGEYVQPVERAKFLSAREELEKAKKAVKDKQWDEVFNHLRPAIDLALKEKFNFKRINPMKQFLVDAENYGLPLPTYTMLYDYFDEGSQRIHSGKLNTPYECKQALEFVAGFIDQLDLIDIPDDKIEEFKLKSKCVN
jgi:hypothetical protein